MDRVQISRMQLNRALDSFESKLNNTLKKKGWGSFASRHEISGMLTEEYNEAIAEVHSGNNDKLEQELLDIAVGAVFAVACIQSKGIDW